MYKFIKISFLTIMLITPISCAVAPTGQGESNTQDSSIRKIADADHRGMTTEERLKADNARKLFDQYYSGSIKNNKSSELSTENKIIIQNWLNLKKKYANIRSFNAEQAIEIGSVLTPMMRAAEMDYRSGSPYNVNRDSITISPHSIVAMHIKGNCMDPHLGAPNKGDKFQLVDIERLIVPELLPVYRDLVAYRSNHPEKSNQVQELVWAIRKGCYEQEQLNRIKAEHFDILDAARPGDSEIFVKYIQGCHSLGNSIARNLFGDFLKESSKTKTSFSNITDDINRLILMPIKGATPDDNSDYSDIGHGVVAHTVGDGPIEAKVEILNTTDKSFDFYPANYAAETQRESQRVALFKPTTIGGKSLGGAISSRLMEAYVKDATKFFRDKTIERTSSTTGLGKLFIKLLGHEFKSPIARLALDSVPVIGNSIAAYEAFSGEDAISGEKLTPAERVLALAATVPGVGTIERLFPGSIKRGLIQNALEALERTAVDRDVAGWAISNTVDELIGPYSPKQFIGKASDRIVNIYSDGARYGVNGLTVS